ncbi:VCBS repeat-containing protein [Rubrolithibacter danxiaensis]|uniref:VCBS repeat-containing protein n=1 Tax=Rubrolithibacter danxiaensis TaxID=3390805 RepID=UPI003BF80F16
MNKVEDKENFNILDYLYFYNGAGVASGDVNNDGKPDLFFVSNQGKNRLYLNQGNLKFKDVSKEAGIEGFSDWKTGVTMVDINGDGWLDIYVCAVGNYKGLEGANELYINNGKQADGSVSFTEKAADYGLDFTGFATQAAFFDYDQDGDLDVYLLNHAVHTSRSYDKVNARNLRNNEAGDYLFENQLISSGKQNKEAIRFKDVSQKAGIYGAAMGYGLGIVITDINQDGWDDIYVTNDFHEDDYCYINNGNGTFTESVKQYFKHLSRFSMGCDAADMNNDGYPDVMTLDMYSDDEKVEKVSTGEDPLDIYLYKLQFGYYNQYSRNCLQLNLSGKKFSDVALMAGVAATDWSWAPLLADYDNDGIKDIFISNGIVKRPNDLDYIKFATTDSMYHAPQISQALKHKAIAMMPEGKVHNYFFKGSSNLQFQDKSLDWGFADANISNGATYADLDNDGDLDLVTNNINEQAGVYLNNSEKLQKNGYLKIHLKGDRLNTFGIGAKVFLKSKGAIQMQQVNPVRGFLSSVEPVLTFGLGKQTTVDSVIVIWPGQKVEVRTKIEANSVITFNEHDATDKNGFLKNNVLPQQSPLFEEITDKLDIKYKHAENNYLDFYRESLIPFVLSTEGPKIAVGDVNGDGLDDFFAGGAKWQSGKLFIQKSNGQFDSTNQALFQADSTYEDVDAVFFDADNDKDLDLYVVSGGNEFYGNMKEQFDRLYLNDGKGNFSKSLTLPPMYDNKSCVRPADFDQDGDIDLFVGGRVVGYKYGEIPRSYLLINDGKGKFSDHTQKVGSSVRNAGLVTDAVWSDYDKDGDLDLLVTADWASVKVFENNKGHFTDVTDQSGLAGLSGFWQTIQAGDFDQDGDMDFIAGNLGTNTKFRKGDHSAVRMYVKDFDGNGVTDQVLAYSRADNWYPVVSKDELGKQMPMINKKFTNYRQYAGKTIDEIFTGEQLEGAIIREVNKFESVLIENKGNKKFVVHNLPKEAQVSKIFSFLTDDFNGDGFPDVLIGGNFYGVSTYQGRYDASYGLMLAGTGKGTFKSVLPTDCGFLLDGEVRDIKQLKTSEGTIILVARNNSPLQVFRTMKNKPIQKR